MKPFRILTLALALAATASLAKMPKMPPEDPCMDKAANDQETCNAKCFPVDPNTRDQVPDAKQKACMKGCEKKVAKNTEKCKAEQAQKQEGKKEKDHARESDI